MERRSVFDSLRPWLGLAGGALGWALTHQIGSDLAFDDCRAADSATIVLLCLAGLILAGAGGLLSLGIARARGESEARRFVGQLSVALVALASFAIILEAVSSLILPLCAS